MNVIKTQEMIEINELDLNVYKMFYLVCQNGSYSKTAKELGLTQPSISYNIKKLENYLGVKLFEKSKYSVFLTPEGENLFPYVERAINDIKKGENTLNDFMNLKIGQISVGVPSHIGVFLLTDIIKSFNKKYPNIKMKVISKPTKELFRLLSSNDLDIVIDCSPLEDIQFDFKVIKIAKEKCVLACNISLKELLDRKVSLDEILQYPLIVPARTSGSTRELIKMFEKKELVFNPAFEIATSDMIAEMAVKGMGIGYLFEKTLNTYPKLEKIDLDIEFPIFDIFMVRKDRHLSQTAQSFIEFLESNIEN